MHAASRSDRDFQRKSMGFGVFFNDNSPTDEGLGRLGVMGTANSILHILFPSHPAIPRTIVLEKNPKARRVRSAPRDGFFRPPMPWIWSAPPRRVRSAPRI